MQPQFVTRTTIRCAGMRAALLGVVLVTGSCAELVTLGEVAFPGIATFPLDEQTVVAGLKEALSTGTSRAASRLSLPGGFYDQPSLRIQLPGEFDGVTRTLRAAGLGAPVDALERKMNDAAERAAGEAVPVFVESIRSMTLQDAFAILEGEPDAATRYFEARTSAALRERFSPVVIGAMNEVGVYRSLQDLQRSYDALPFSKPALPTVDGYITDRALSGLFTTLSDEEKRIREDPAARTSALLRRVFGG